MLDDHDLVAMAAMPAVIAMTTVFGACAIAVVAAAALDHNGFSAGNRRGGNDNSGKRRKRISKLLHGVLFSSCAEIEHQTHDNVPDGTQGKF